jgi:hypothetical protein
LKPPLMMQNPPTRVKKSQSAKADFATPATISIVRPHRAI